MARHARTHDVHRHGRRPRDSREHRHRQLDILGYIFGIYMFVVLATLLGWTIRLSGHMNTVNIVWQSASIVSLFAVSAYMFKEPVTLLHLLGVGLAIGAGLCYTV